MDNIKAINYTGFNYQCAGEEWAKENLRLMKKMTACNTVIIVLGALQEEKNSNEIDYEHAVMPNDADLVDFIRYARTLELQVILKPVIDCEDGTEREKIDFIENGEFQKGKFEQWFLQYMKFVLHYAAIAEKTGCEMFFVGSRLVQLENQQEAWKELIERVRDTYHGKLTYEADTYGENRIGFWNSLDLIATSGNYPYYEMERELARLSELSAILKMEVFLSECGCMSTRGSADDPKAWDFDGTLCLQEQVEYMQNLFVIGRRHDCITGIGVWCWNNRRQLDQTAQRDKHYYIYGKPVCGFIYHEWAELLPIRVAI